MATASCRRRLAALLKALQVEQPDRVAHGLIDEFGSLAATLAAGRWRVSSIAGTTVAIQLATVQSTMVHVARRRIQNVPVLQNWEALQAYLSLELAHDPHESLRVLHLNTRQVLLRDETICQGTIDGVTVDVRMILRRALEVGSAGLILVHNHPSGDPEPSAADRSLTRAVSQAGRTLDVRLHDHVIVARGGVSSFKAMGLL